METQTTTLTDFLLARIAEDAVGARRALDLDERFPLPDVRYEKWVRESGQSYTFASGAPSPHRVLAECESKRRIVEWHQNWPVLAQTEPEVEFTGNPTDLNAMSVHMHQRISWLTEQEYRTKFGDEPPSSPILLMLAMPYADHPDFDEAWRV